MKRVYWTGYCKQTRLESIRNIENVISKYGFINNFNLFSDISISLIIEIEEKNIDLLYDNLSELIYISDYKKINSTSKLEYYIFLNISFVNGTGNLIIEVPNVPG